MIQSEKMSLFALANVLSRAVVTMAGAEVDSVEAGAEEAGLAAEAVGTAIATNVDSRVTSVATALQREYYSLHFCPIALLLFILFILHFCMSLPFY